MVKKDYQQAIEILNVLENKTGLSLKKLRRRCGIRDNATTARLVKKLLDENHLKKVPGQGEQCYQKL